MGLKTGKLRGQLVDSMDCEGGAGGTDRLPEGKLVEVNCGNKALIVGSYVAQVQNTALQFFQLLGVSSCSQSCL